MAYGQLRLIILELQPHLVPIVLWMLSLFWNYQEPRVDYEKLASDRAGESSEAVLTGSLPDIPRASRCGPSL